MGRLGCVAAFACAAALIGAALAPADARAKDLSGEANAEAVPGITVAGIGFGRRDGVASERAVAEARRRADAVAAALGVGVGATEAVETPGLTQFGSPRPCGRGGRDGCRGATRAVAAIVTFAIAGAAPHAASPRSVVVTGAATTAVEPRDPDRSRSIKRAMLAARRAVTPRAATDAARRAHLTAQAASLRLGALVSVSEARPTYYYGPGFFDTALGTFGPGRFCGIVRHPVLRRDPKTGVTHVVRRVPRRHCYSPTSYSLSFTVAYEAS